MFGVQVAKAKCKQKFLILLIYQLQFLCHGIWIIRASGAAASSLTVSTITTTTTPTLSSFTSTLLFNVSTTTFTPITKSKLPVSSSRESIDSGGGDKDLPNSNKLLTSAFTFNNLKSSIYSQEETEADILLTNNSKISQNNYKILGVHTKCSREFFEMNLDLNFDFHGLLYAKDFPLECRARGKNTKNITLRLPTSGCGVRSEPRIDGGMELSVRIMLQIEQKLRQSSDIVRKIQCELPLNALKMNVATSTAPSKKTKNHRNARMHSFENNQSNASQNPDPSEQSNNNRSMPRVTSTPSTSSTPRVRIWLELGDRDGSGVVEVGQDTTLTVRAVVPGNMGVRVVDCAALDGLGESTQQLVDERGCPIDEQVMPALHTTSKPAEEGWSKQQDDDLVEKVFSATFPAFKFPDRERLHVSCGVQLCKNNCPNINCSTSESLLPNADAHLARIEVFNSLAVTAPQIEVDRLRDDPRYYNMTAEEYAPNVRPFPPDGTLCMSLSKLAVSFCVLGLIFLVAIIVSITSLIAKKRKASLISQANRLHRAEVCTSMFSSSSESAQSTRFGSKLFMPYPTTTLPYGRVY